MVTRKPNPGDADAESKSNPPLQPYNDTEKGQDTSWACGPLDLGPDRVWGDHFHRDSVAPHDAPGMPEEAGPGQSAYLTSMEPEGNVWAEGASDSRAHVRGQEDAGRLPAALPAPTGDPSYKSPGEANRGSPSPAAFLPVDNPVKKETNPFKRKAVGGGSAGGNRTSSQEDTSSLRRVPAHVPPATSFSDMSLDEAGNNPWQPALNEWQDDIPPSSVWPSDDLEAGRDGWSSGQPSRQPSPPSSQSAVIMSLASQDGSAVWDEIASDKALSSFSLGEGDVHGPHAWDNLGTRKGKTSEKSEYQDASALGSGTGGEWNLIDVAPEPPKSGSVGGIESAEASSNPLAQPPTLPPTLPPRSATPERYQIRKINWSDATAASNPRRSPILLQNSNGPCPLVALVNALVLTTPSDMEDTSLLATLRSREHVSLELLLNAVFDELMSERRMRAGSDLPDVGQLYDFLKDLDTGMIVNPRYMPTPGTAEAMKRTSLTHLHPTERADAVPGTFEQTLGMELYSTFSIPLIHGWLPAKDDAAYAALARRAVSYEDAQNLLCLEDELEEKLSRWPGEGLTEEEQDMLVDMQTIKSFLTLSATQLTEFGLEIITKAMKPGSFAILFRNEHFSTLYRHPHTLRLFTLVTDTGFANHDEIVWESLVDVSGERAEFWSGDFRIVGGAHEKAGERAGAIGREPTALSGRGQDCNQARPKVDPILSPDQEQEDGDLALAMQLQEEEDERVRQGDGRRQRESRLSSQFFDRQGTRSGTGTGAMTGSPRGNPQGVRSLLPPRAQEVRRGPETNDDAPPSYEQAAQQSAVNPATGHASHPNASPMQEPSPSPRLVPTMQGHGRGRRPWGAAMGGNSMGGNRPRPGVQPLTMMGAPKEGKERERDCTVM